MVDLSQYQHEQHQSYQHYQDAVYQPKYYHKGYQPQYHEGYQPQYEEAYQYEQPPQQQAEPVMEDEDGGFPEGLMSCRFYRTSVNTWHASFGAIK